VAEMLVVVVHTHVGDTCPCVASCRAASHTESHTEGSIPWEVDRRASLRPQAVVRPWSCDSLVRLVRAVVGTADRSSFLGRLVEDLGRRDSAHLD